MSSVAEYKLSCVLYGHSVDVRGLAVTADGLVVSASRDKTAKLWKLEGFNPEAIQTFSGHEHYVACVCALSPNSTQPDGVILTGSNDHTICAFNPKTGEGLYKLEGHENAVCCLWAGANGRVLSSSWDGTARVWSGTSEVAKLAGHEAAVWAVTELPGSGKIVTASADKSLKVWAEQSCEKTLTGHEDCVRGLAPVSAVEFLSCANDASVRLWRVSGECLGVYYGHPNYIYSVSLLPDGGFVSSGEDQSVRVWQASGECDQQIKLPAQSVWAVVALPSGDFATASSDGAVRVFSRDPSRQASEDSLTTFQQEVASFGRTTQEEIGGYKLSDLPGKETLNAPGKHDGQKTMVREDNAVVCYEWSQAELMWKRVGEVVGAKPPAEGKTSYLGKEYDFVFNIDIEDGKPALKLPYNRGEDPWVAAQNFIHQNDTNQSFLDTIADFIIKNSGGAPTLTPNSSYVDPFTGGSRYVPGSSGGLSGQAAVANPDPFTGGSRYVPGSSGGQSSRPTAVNPDPFTGGSSYTSAASRQASLPVVLEYHLFEQAKLEGILVKLQEFNLEAWKPLEEGAVVEVVKLAEPGHAPNPQAEQLLQGMLTWKQERLFPVLDLVRLAVRHADVNASLCSGDFAPLLISNVLRPSLSPKSPELTRLMAVRVAANMLAHPAGERMATENAEFLLSVVAQLSLPNSNPSPRQQIALATLLFNLSVAALRGHPQLKKQALPIAALTLPRLSDVEAQRRCLRALANILSQSDQDMLNQAKDKKLPESLAIFLGEASLSEIAGQILAILP